MENGNRRLKSQRRDRHLNILSSIFDLPSSRFLLRRRRSTARAPVIATLFCCFKEFVNRLRIRTVQDSPEFFKFNNVGIERFAEILPICQRNVAPHFRRPRCNARRVPKPVGTERGLHLRLNRIQNITRQRGGDNMRKMTGPAYKDIVLPGSEPQRSRAQSFPKLLDFPHGVAI